MVRPERLRSFLRGLLLIGLFLSQLVLAALLHLDTAVTRRTLKRWASYYLSSELRGSIDIGRLDTLTLSSIWLQNVTLYDEQQRPVVTLSKVRASSNFLPALRRWLTNNESLTLVIESVRVDGVQVHLHPDPLDQQPSLLAAIEPDRSRSAKTTSPNPYRIFLSNVELGDINVDSTLPDFVTNSARLRGLSGQLLFTDQGVAASLKRFSLDLSGPNTIALHAFGTLEYRTPSRLWGDVNATVGQVPFSAHVQYQNETLELDVSAFRVSPAAARSLLPDWSLLQPLTASLKTHGPLGELGVRLELDAGTAHVEAAGTVSLGPSRRADLTLEGRAIDIQSLFGQALPSDIDAAARVTLSMVDGLPYANLDGVIHPSRVLNFATPRIDLQGQYDSEGLMLSGRSSDPNLPIRAAAVLRNQEIDIDAQVDGVDLGRLAKGLGATPCRGLARLRGRAKIAKNRIASTVDLTLHNLSVGSTNLARATGAARFDGPLGTPKAWTGEVELDATRLNSPYAQFDKLALRAQGSAEKAHFTLAADKPGIAKIAFEADVLPLQGPKLNAGRLELTRGANALSLGVESLAYSDGTVVLDGLTLDGSAGHARGSLGLQADHVYGRFLGQSLNLTVISDLLGLPTRSLGGHASFELDVDTRQQPAKGFVRLDFERASLGPLTNVSGNLELGLAAERLMGEATVQSDLVDQIHSSIDVTLGGSPTRLSSYTRAQGSASLDLSRVRLDRVGTLLELYNERFNVTGTANVRLSAERSDAAALPNLTLSTVTNQLRVTVPYASNHVQLESKDLLFSVAYLGDTGQVKGDWVLSQNSLPKASLSFTTAIASPEVWLEDPVGAMQTLRELPFEAFLSLPKQSLKELGNTAGIPIGTGDVELKVWLKGPIADARLVTEFQGSRLLLEPLGNGVGFDVQGLVEYARRSGEARVLLAAGSQAQPFLQVNGIGTITPCNLGFACISDWSGRIEAGLSGLPLEAVPVLDALGFAGEVRGVLSARRADGKTQVDGVLPVDNFRISGRPLGQSLLSVRSNEKDLIANAKLLDGGAQIDFEAQLPMNWQHLLPSRRTDVPVRLAANAKGYDAGFLAPWLDDTITDLAGELSGSVEALYSTPSVGEEKSGPQLALGGHLTLRHGKVTARTMGLTLSDIALDAQASSTAARTTISVPNISASVGEGTNNLAGAAVIELGALSLKRLAVRVERAQNAPLIVNSVTLATLSGSANIEMKPVTTGYDVGIEFTELDVRLPRSGAREVVGLTENPDIVVLQPLGPIAWRKSRSSNSTEYHLRLSLGKKSRVSRTDFNLPITGTPELVLGNRMRPSGSIQLEQMGRLEMFGKAFVIERGHITLDPAEPTNPRLDVTATWRGPSHVVTIQIQGKADDARLRFSSDPALASESQVMALLLGGSGNDSTAGAGLGVGATLFNELLSDTALSSLEVRTSSDERHANYTAAVPLRDNLWFEATYQSPTSTNLPGSSAQKGFSGTVDYRFHRDWSVRTEVGTLGAGADLMWQYRY